MGGQGPSGSWVGTHDAYSLELLLAAVVGLSSASSPQDTGHWDREVCFARLLHSQETETNPEKGLPGRSDGLEGRLEEGDPSQTGERGSGVPTAGLGDSMGIPGLGPGAGGQVGLGLRTGPGRDLAGAAERWGLPRWREGRQGCERAGWAPWRRRCWESIICRWKLWVCEPWRQGACALCPSLRDGAGRTGDQKEE